MRYVRNFSLFLAIVSTTILQCRERPKDSDRADATIVEMRDETPTTDKNPEAQIEASAKSIVMLDSGESMKEPILSEPSRTKEEFLNLAKSTGDKATVKVEDCVSRQTFFQQCACAAPGGKTVMKQQTCEKWYTSSGAYCYTNCDPCTNVCAK